MPFILLVDESSETRSIVAHQVHGLGFAADEASDGPTALSRLRDRRYDLVILEHALPTIDGPSVLATLRADGDQTPVLMLTAEARASEIARCVKLGIHGYVLKPFKLAELRSSIVKVLGDRPSAPPPDTARGDNVISLGGPASVGERLSSFIEASERMLETIAASQFGDAIVDLSGAPLGCTPQLVLGLLEATSHMGLELKLVGGPDVRSVLSEFSETCELAIFDSVPAARTRT
jgi:DNA-binding response OmpR family regulator